MKRVFRLVPWLIGTSAVALTALLGHAVAQSPPASPSVSSTATAMSPPSASSTGAATAAAEAFPGALPNEKPLDFEPIPTSEEKPKSPTAAEWQAAPQVRFTARGPRAKSCKMFRVREWLKVRCERQNTAISLLGGASEGAFLWMPEAKEKEPAPSAAEVMFPIKPGDRRVFELFSYGPAYGGSMISPGLLLQEHWIAGETLPVVVIR
ncbi:MAG: hypothetical protein IPK82_43380 [Polyangiaceae bacterium]|nr:hypothetical protein [Polyangiaceae bacterium]